MTVLQDRRQRHRSERHHHRLGRRQGDPRLAGQPHRRGRRRHRGRVAGPGGGPVRRVDRGPRGGRAPGRRQGPLRRQGRPDRGRQRRPSGSGPRSWASTPPTRRASTTSCSSWTGRPNKGELGANAILGVSLAVRPRGRLVPRDAALPLARRRRGADPPVPMFNILNGGKHAQDSDGLPGVHGHADRPIDSFPDGAARRRRGVRRPAEDPPRRGPRHRPGRRGRVRAVAAVEPGRRRDRPAGDRGGRATGPATQIGIALDPAVSELVEEGSGRTASPPATSLAARGPDAGRPASWSTCGPTGAPGYPIVSLEDGLGEDDWDGWQLITERLGAQGPARGRRPARDQRRAHPQGDRRRAAERVLIKLNQIGTLTETIDAIELARRAG